MRVFDAVFAFPARTLCACFFTRRFVTLTYTLSLLLTSSNRYRLNKSWIRRWAGFVLYKPGFHMSGKSQTVWDFTVSRPSQILPTNENSKSKKSPIVWNRTGTNLENRERFYFPDASQISAMVGDHSRQMKLKFVPSGTSASVGDGFRSLPIP